MWRWHSRAVAKRAKRCCTCRLRRAATRLPCSSRSTAGEAVGARSERETGFDALADRQGFAVVLYPSSAGPSWAISGPRTDVTFTTRLLAHLEALTCIDARRLYVTGLSNGAGMAARLACEAEPPDRRRPVPMAGYYGALAQCEPASPESLLEVHGTADTVVRRRRRGRPRWRHRARIRGRVGRAGWLYGGADESRASGACRALQVERVRRRRARGAVDPLRGRAWLAGCPGGSRPRAGPAHDLRH